MYAASARRGWTAGTTYACGASVRPRRTELAALSRYCRRMRERFCAARVSTESAPLCM
jgi:hypothetical protein